MSQFQKQPPEVFYRKSCSWKFRNIPRKAPVLESPFNRLAGCKTCNFLKKRLQHMNIAKFLRKLILIDICEQLLLPFLLLTVIISSQVLVSTLSLIGLLQRSSSMFKEFSLGCLVVGYSFIWKQEKLTQMVTRCHSLSFVVTRCTTRCHSLYHSLSLVITLCTTRLSFYKRSM